eukprot:Amastigsp_a343_365.p4 type:complete len:164 gc:universal Amastigsp_a343_365:995-1486(+)
MTSPVLVSHEVRLHTKPFFLSNMASIAIARTRIGSTSKIPCITTRDAATVSVRIARHTSATEANALLVNDPFVMAGVAPSPSAADLNACEASCSVPFWPRKTALRTSTCTGKPYFPPGTPNRRGLVVAATTSSSQERKSESVESSSQLAEELLLDHALVGCTA